MNVYCILKFERRIEHKGENNFNILGFKPAMLWKDYSRFNTFFFLLALYILYKYIIYIFKEKPNKDRLF